MYWKLRVKVGEARHVYITGSRPLAHSYANEISWSERILEQV